MIFVGLGFRKAVTTKSFENLFRQVFNLTELPGPIKALATLDTKALNKPRPYPDHKTLFQDAYQGCVF